MSEQNTPLPPAGWYADPENAAGERWWNGTTWGDERRAKDAVPPIPVAPPIAPAIPVAAVPVEAAAPVPAAAPLPAAPSAAVLDDRPNPYATPAPYGANPYAAPYGSQPGAYATASPNPNPVALVGFIISMASIVLNLFLTGLVGIAGGIVSAIGLAKANRLAAQGVTPNGRGLALAGTIVGFAGGGLSILFFILVMVFSFAASF